MTTTSDDTADMTLPTLLDDCRAALTAVRNLIDSARRGVADLIAPGGTIEPNLLENEQTAAHGFAWLATYGEGLAHLLAWAERLETAGRLGELERLMLQVGYGEYLAQMVGGIAMSQVEIVRPTDMGIEDDTLEDILNLETHRLIRMGNAPALRVRIAALLDLDGGRFGDLGLEDETLELVREQFHRFVEDQVTPFCHDWHLDDALIPMAIIEQMAELGVFGLTVPEAFGGLDMGKTAMCVVTEELSRGYIGVGSLGTRSEIAAELIRLGGTDAQRAHYLPRLAAGELLPTAVFTEPNTGSDLAALQTRAVKDGNVYRITGNKTWITHAARSDMMTLLARTDPDDKSYKGLSMFLVDKTRGDDRNPFPDARITGGEIGVLGYRGMKEYEIAFDGLEVPAGSLLGGVEGLGFKHLMATFEAARIQTAARAVGVAQNAMEEALKYARERLQFGKPILAFPRIAGKIGWMAVETMIARQLTYFSAREKDGARRCDIEAGMAKLLAARVAWSNADAALQIHGGNGYALEYPISRILVDARILNIFEGAAEIQAQVVARGLIRRDAP